MRTIEYNGMTFKFDGTDDALGHFLKLLATKQKVAKLLTDGIK